MALNICERLETIRTFVFFLDSRPEQLMVTKHNDIPFFPPLGHTHVWSLLAGFWLTIHLNFTIFFDFGELLQRKSVRSVIFCNIG